MELKFYVSKLTRYPYGMGEVELSPTNPIIDPHPNRNFWKYTPNGTICLKLDNSEAIDLFKKMGRFTVTIEEDKKHE